MKTSKVKIYEPKIISHARALRKAQTPHEAKLWYFLRSNRFKAYKFRRQFPVGNYIVDFYCFKQKLTIELDGGQHNDAESASYDKQRDAFLRSQGFSVLRLWNNELDSNLEGVLDRIYVLLTKQV